MGAFSAGWLALREPADHAARSARLTAAIRDSIARPGGVAILDLGTGTGSNLRYLLPRLSAPQHWLLLDSDDSLLDAARTQLRDWTAAAGHSLLFDSDRATASPTAPSHTNRGVDGSEGTIRVRRADLATLDPRLFDGRALVTGSALLDLVSKPWLEALAAECRRCQASVLFPLIYDGRFSCEPAEPEDAQVCSIIARHQRGDKGFGPALGPEAADATEATFGVQGYDVERESSDWHLSSEAQELQRQLVGGWVTAAVELEPQWAARLRDWAGRRLAHIDAGRSRISVGHLDVAAWPR